MAETFNSLGVVPTGACSPHRQPPDHPQQPALQYRPPLLLSPQPYSPFLSSLSNGLSMQSFEQHQLHDSPWTCVSCGEPVRDLFCLPCLHPLALCSSVGCTDKVRHNRVHCPDCEEMFTIQPEALPWQPLATRKAKERQQPLQVSAASSREDLSKSRSLELLTPPSSSSSSSTSSQQHHARSRSGGEVDRSGGGGSDPGLRQDAAASLSSSESGELLSGTIPPPPSSESVSSVCCLEHHSRPANLFCHTCGVLVCDQCVHVLPNNHRHRHHHCTPLSKDVVAEQQTYILSYFKSVNTIAERLAQASKQVAASKQVLGEKKEHAKALIRHMADELITGIVIRRDELCNVVDDISSTKEQQLDVRHREIGALLRRFVQFQKVSQMLLDEGSIPEQLAIKRTYLERVKALHSMFHSTDVGPNVSTLLEFSRNEAVLQIQGRIHALGRVSQGPDPAKCSIELYGCLIVQDSVRLQSYDPVWLVLHTRSWDNEPCRRGGDSAEALLVPVTTGVALRAYTEDLEDGTYRFSFPGVPADECLLSVRINGRPVANVPKFYRFLDYSCKLVISASEAGHDKLMTLAISRTGTLAATDESKKQICIFSQEGTLTKVLGRGKGKKEEEFQEWMRGIAFSSRGLLAVSDSDNGRVQLYDSVGQFVRIIGQGELRDPRSLAFDASDRLLVLDDNRVLFYSAETGHLLKTWDHLVPNVSLKRKLHQFSLSSDGELYIIDKENTEILVFSEEGKFQRSFGKPGRQKGKLHTPNSIAVTRDSFVLVTSHHKISIFSKTGEFVQEIASKGEREGYLHNPFGIVADSRGRIYVADRNNHRIQVF